MAKIKKDSGIVKTKVNPNRKRKKTRQGNSKNSKRR